MGWIIIFCWLGICSLLAILGELTKVPALTYVGGIGILLLAAVAAVY